MINPADMTYRDLRNEMQTLWDKNKTNSERYEALRLDLIRRRIPKPVAKCTTCQDTGVQYREDCDMLVPCPTCKA